MIRVTKPVGKRVFNLWIYESEGGRTEHFQRLLMTGSGFSAIAPNIKEQLFSIRCWVFSAPPWGWSAVWQANI